MTDPNWQVGLPELVQSYYLPTPVDGKVLGWLNDELVNVDVVVPPPINTSSTWCGTAAGSANAIALSPSTPITSYVIGSRFTFIATNPNTSSVTVSISGLSALSAKTISDIAFIGGEIQPGIVDIIYDGIGFKVLTTVPFVQSGGSSVLRTAQAKIGEMFSVKDKGALGDGVADDAAAFSSAHSTIAAGTIIYVPNGTYKLNSNVTATGRHFFLDGGVTFTGAGRLVGAIVRSIDSASGAMRFGVGEPSQFGSYYKFGRTAGGVTGLVVGGGDVLDGDIGNVIYADGYGGWTTMQALQYPSSTELAVQPTSLAGRGSVVLAGNTLTRVSGALFLAEMVGRRIYIGSGQRYLVSSVNVGAQTLVVTNLDSSPVSFAATGTFTFCQTGVKGAGVCNTSGTAVTRVYGDPFVPMSNTEYLFTVNGTSYTVNSVTDYTNIVLTSSAGTQTSVSYTFWTSVDDISAAVRVHRVSGAGFEENITLAAYGDGYFHLHAGGGAGDQYPLYIGTGWTSGGAKRQTISLQSNGILNLGGNAGQCSLHIDDMNGSSSNYLQISGATAGNSPILVTRGTDTNIQMSLDAKGSSGFVFTNTAFASTLFRIEGDGSLAIGAAGSFGGGAKVVFLANRTTAPTSNPTGGGILYAESGALKYRGSGGTITTVAAA